MTSCLRQIHRQCPRRNHRTHRPLHASQQSATRDQRHRRKIRISQKTPPVHYPHHSQGIFIFVTQDVTNKNKPVNKMIHTAGPHPLDYHPSISCYFYPFFTALITVTPSAPE